MKTVIFLLFTTFALALSAQTPQPESGQSKNSRFVDLAKKYNLNPEQVKWLDSLQNPRLSIVAISGTPLRKKVLIPNKLYVAQEIVPVQAQIVVDTFSGYNEVIAYRLVTTIVSELDEPGSFKRYFDNLNTYKKEIAARLRKEIENLEKDQ